MFVQKTVFEKLAKHVQSQQQGIEKLQEMLGILAQTQGKQFEFDVGKVWKVTNIRPEHNQFIDDRRQRDRSSE
jgi:hypothetical protein